MCHMSRKKKQAITLLEIMIVIFLIGIIGSAIGYNVKGSLEQGKAFKSEQGAAQILDILTLEIANGKSVDNVVEYAADYLEESGLCKDVSKLLQDGWGVPYNIYNKDGELAVESNHLELYKNKKKQAEAARDAKAKKKKKQDAQNS